LEESLEDIGFEEFHILRPCLLLGKRTETRPAEYVLELVMGFLSFLIPWKFRLIHASSLSKIIKCLIGETRSGKHIWEGRSLFEIQ
jgi:hypothetical protein